MATAKGPAVEGVHPVGVEVAGQVGRAADAADGEYLVGQQAQLGAATLQGVQHAEIAATRAPVRVHLAFEVPGGQLYLRPAIGYADCRHFVTSLDNNF